MTDNTSAKIIKATDKQLTFLAQLGYAGDLRTLTIDQAGSLIEQLKAQIDQARQRIKKGADILASAERRVELHREAKGEYSGPCPKCGGNDRFHCAKEWFFCRQCHPKRGDIIEYTSWLNNVSYLDAIKMLDNGVAVSLVNEPLKPVKPVHKLNEWDEAKQLQKAADATKTLTTGGGKYAAQAREYLQSRGLIMETAQAFKLGCRHVTLPGAWDEEKKALSYPKQLAVLLPWFSPTGALVAVKHRFLESHSYTDKDGKPRTENKTSRGNFTGCMFGWQAIKGPERCIALIITEGEINALSLWQAGNGLVDVLSTGTESMLQTLPNDVVTFARQYQHVIVWADKGALADSVALAIGAAAMRSPGGQDANDLLQADKLEKLLAAMLRKIGATVETPSPALSTEQPIEDDSHPVSDEEWQRIMAQYGRPHIEETKPPLPADLWQTGMDAGASWQLFNELRETYQVVRGKNEDGFYILAADKAGEN